MPDRITKETLKALREKLNPILAEFAAKHGLAELYAGNGGFDPNGCFTFKLEGVIGGGLNRDAARYENERAMLGLPSLGSTIMFAGQKHTITGMKSGGKIKLDREDGSKRIADMDVILAKTRTKEAA